MDMVQRNWILPLSHKLGRELGQDRAENDLSGPEPMGQNWLDQVFQAKSAAMGGVVRRRVRDVEREIGRAAFELEVRSRGFHLIECNGHFVVLCSHDAMQIHC